MKKIPVIIDCDPGADDALALLLALHSEKLSVLGITTVCGNASAAQTAANAAKILGLAGAQNVLAYQGAEQPLQRKLTFSSLYCGADGLCETGLDDCPGLLAGEQAQSFLIRTLLETREPVTVISTAGYTNLAAALLKEPSIRSGIRGIVSASGYFGLNQKECRAEWNILVDPEAAQIVYESGIPNWSLGLDVSSMLENTMTEELLREGSGAVSTFLQRCDAYNRRRGLEPYSLLVDAMAVAAVLQPDLAEYTQGNATVHPERQDAGLITFVPGEGNFCAANCFDYAQYLTMLKGLTEG